jgi:hypothetical protein
MLTTDILYRFTLVSKKFYHDPGTAWAQKHILDFNPLPSDPPSLDVLARMPGSRLLIPALSTDRYLNPPTPGLDILARMQGVRVLYLPTLSADRTAEIISILPLLTQMRELNIPLRPLIRTYLEKPCAQMPHLPLLRVLRLFSTLDIGMDKTFSSLVRNHASQLYVLTVPSVVIFEILRESPPPCIDQLQELEITGRTPNDHEISFLLDRIHPECKFALGNDRMHLSLLLDAMRNLPSDALLNLNSLYQYFVGRWGAKVGLNRVSVNGRHLITMIIDEALTRFAAQSNFRLVVDLYKMEIQYTTDGVIKHFLALCYRSLQLQDADERRDLEEWLYGDEFDRIARSFAYYDRDLHNLAPFYTLLLQRAEQMSVPFDLTRISRDFDQLGLTVNTLYLYLYHHNPDLFNSLVFAALADPSHAGAVCNCLASLDDLKQFLLPDKVLEAWLSCSDCKVETKERFLNQNGRARRFPNAESFETFLLSHKLYPVEKPGKSSLATTIFFGDPPESWDILPAAFALFTRKPALIQEFANCFDDAILLIANQIIEQEFLRCVLVDHPTLAQIELALTPWAALFSACVRSARPSTPSHYEEYYSANRFSRLLCQVLSVNKLTDHATFSSILMKAFECFPQLATELCTIKHATDSQFELWFPRTDSLNRVRQIVASASESFIGMNYQSSPGGPHYLQQFEDLDGHHDFGACGEYQDEYESENSFSEDVFEEY